MWLGILPDLSLFLMLSVHFNVPKTGVYIYTVNMGKTKNWGYFVASKMAVR